MIFAQAMSKIVENKIFCKNAKDHLASREMREHDFWNSSKLGMVCNQKQCNAQDQKSLQEQAMIFHGSRQQAKAIAQSDIGVHS